MKHKIYLDDVRTPIDDSWIIVRDYYQFVKKIEEIGFENIELVSLDHDLGESAMKEWQNNVYPNNKLDYNNIIEKTGYDCAKYLVSKWMDGECLFDVFSHSANVVGRINIISLINNYRKSINLDGNSCVVSIDYTMDKLLGFYKLSHLSNDELKSFFSDAVLLSYNTYIGSTDNTGSLNINILDMLEMTSHTNANACIDRSIFNPNDNYGEVGFSLNAEPSYRLYCFLTIDNLKKLSNKFNLTIE